MTSGTTDTLLTVSWTTDHWCSLQGPVRRHWFMRFEWISKENRPTSNCPNANYLYAVVRMGVIAQRDDVCPRWGSAPPTSVQCKISRGSVNHPLYLLKSNTSVNLSKGKISKFHCHVVFYSGESGTQMLAHNFSWTQSCLLILGSPVWTVQASGPCTCLAMKHTGVHDCNVTFSDFRSNLYQSLCDWGMNSIYIFSPILVSLGSHRFDKS